MTTLHSNATLAARGLKSVNVLGAGRDHGDRLRYMAGCRCGLCRKANSAYECARQRARKAGDWNGIVSAEKARAHMKMLSRAGVGRRIVQACTDIADTVLQDIRKGRKLRIRARTERLILAVTAEQRGDAALVSAKSTWKLINELLEEGYTRKQLLERLGQKGYGIQIKKHLVTVRTRNRIEKLHRDLTT